ncbi:hypothetical protein V8C43DRAFT_135810 [Trichoderma afarasin]
MTSAGGDFPSFSSHFTHLILFLWLCPLPSISPGAWASHQQSLQRSITQSPNSAVLNKTAIHSVQNKLPCSRVCWLFAVVCWLVAVSSLPPLPGASRHGPRFRDQGISGPICGVAYNLFHPGLASGFKKTSMPKTCTQHCGCDCRLWSRAITVVSSPLDQSLTESRTSCTSRACV